MDKRVQYVEARSQAYIKSSLPYDFPLGFYREGTILPVSVGAGLLPLRRRATVRADLPAMGAALQAQTLSTTWLHRGRRLRIHRLVTCVFTGRTNCVFTQVITCSFTGCHLRFYRARRLRSNTKPPASAAAAPSPSARFTPVRGNCSPAMGSRVPSGAGAVLGLPGCPGAAVGWVDAVGLAVGWPGPAVGWPGPAVGCPGADDAVGLAVGCGEVVGWPGVVGVPVGAAVGAGEGWPVGAAVGLAVGATVGAPVGLTVG